MRLFFGEFEGPDGQEEHALGHDCCLLAFWYANMQLAYQLEIADVYGSVEHGSATEPLGLLAYWEYVHNSWYHVGVWIQSVFLLSLQFWS